MRVLERVLGLGTSRGGQRMRNVLNPTKGRAHTRWRWHSMTVVDGTSKPLPCTFDRCIEADGEHLKSGGRCKGVMARG